MNKANAHRSTFTVLLIPSVFLSACVSSYDRRFADFDEPHRTGLSKLLREQPDSTFARAFRGDPTALHETFARVLDPELDGAASESFTFEIMAIRGSLGDARFFTALSQEPPETQRGMNTFAPRPTQ